jgi:NAD+ kinase
MTTRTAGRRVLVLGRNSEPVVDLVRAAGLRPVDDAPDLVITWGGDGLLLGSEREWPEIPKLPLRNSRHGKRCGPHEVQDALDRFLSGGLSETRWKKLQADARGETLVALNDVLVHNSRPTSGVRYRVWIDGREFGREILGDGVVVATPFGSTAYYRSITRSIFKEGIGLAFNNSTEPLDHLVLPAETEIRVRITRGPALATADNDPRMITLEEDDEVRIRRAPGEAIILGLDGDPV